MTYTFYRLKDSDVTWLYGPLHTVIRTEEDPFLKPRQATTEDTLGLMVPYKKSEKPLKSALKKLSTADLLKRSASELLINNEQTTTTSTAILDNKGKGRRKLSISVVNDELHAVSPSILATHRQPRLRFNHQVEQCIALTDHEDIMEENESDLMEDSDEDTDMIITSHITYSNERKKSIKMIAPARLKKSQSDVDTDDVSSISSVSTASSVGYITRSPAISSPVVASPVTGHLMDHMEDGEEKEEYMPTDAPLENMLEKPVERPVYSTMRSSSSSINSVTQSYKEKTTIAEPALVTMHQTATDIHKDNGNNTNVFNNIATWAASYLWKSENSRESRVKYQHRASPPPQPQPSTSASIIPSSAIPIERPYAQTSSNSSSL